MEQDFICGVVEGFYGRPWTSEQRKALFAKIKRWGMNSYVYAPKDDCKHRAYWRTLYTVEESELLTTLIRAAKEEGITFYYALSPGLDMTYSKETAILKRKLEQVRLFGCEAFALLFDDIESEMCEPDKDMFQSFAHAQVAVTNELYNHLGAPKFLFCPTEYCSTRAVPTVTRSEYLSTIGNKLAQDIDILWTGSKVISKNLTAENLEEITTALKRRPLIWDNLHANDYDQKRVFLGPYTGRHPALIPLLRGVLTNPNCEFHMNSVAVHTLAMWSKCVDESSIDASASVDAKLEAEDDDVAEEIPRFISNNVYHAKKALRIAICDWIPEFSVKKQAYGPITKPQPQVTMVMPIIPIIPSINTCMTLTTTTPTTSTSANSAPQAQKIPELNTNELQALADVCSNIVPNTALPSPLLLASNSSHAISTCVTTSTGITMTTDVVASNIATPMPNVIMNSLVSPTKIVTDDSTHSLLANVAIPDKLPVACLPPPVSVIEGGEERCSSPSMDQDMPVGSGKEEAEAIEVEEGTSNAQIDDEPMEECANAGSPKQPSSLRSEDVVMAENVSGGSGMTMESVEAAANAKTPDTAAPGKSEMTVDDLQLLCDLFYLPFEHGSRSLFILNEFYWLKNNARILVASDGGGGKQRHGSVSNGNGTASKPETAEWNRRAAKFEHISSRVFELARKLVRCENKEIVHELYSYLWELTGALALLLGYIGWLRLGQFPQNINSFTQGSYTWFSKGWKESFMSGDQEPWVFRGGLVADLQRLIPVDNANDLFLYKFPEQPNDDFMSIRPYTYADEETIYGLWNSYVCCDWGVAQSSIPESLRAVAADCVVGPFITISPAFSLVIENREQSVITGFICGAPNAKQFHQNAAMCWWPTLVERYPQEAFTEQVLGQVPEQLKGALQNHGKQIHNSEAELDECPEDVLAQFPSLMICCIWPVNAQEYFSLAKRLATVLFAALRSCGSFGVHTWIEKKNAAAHDFYAKIGFNVVHEDLRTGRCMLGRKF